LSITYAGALVAVAATVLSANAASGRQSTGTAAVFVPCRLGFGARQFDGQQQSFPLVAAGFPTPPNRYAVVGCRQLGCLIS